MDDAEYNELIAYVARRTETPESFLRGDAEMSDEKHTKEPWEFVYGEANVFGEHKTAEGSICADDQDGVTDYIAKVEVDGPNPEADARRIVAAVNAVAGIPTDELESMATDATQWRRLDELSEAASFYANKGDTK